MSVKNKFDILQNLTTAEEKWQKMKESITTAAKEHIPTTVKRPSKKWMTQDICRPYGRKKKI